MNFKVKVYINPNNLREVLEFEWIGSSLIECVPSMRKVLGLIPSASKYIHNTFICKQCLKNCVGLRDSSVG